MLYLSSYRRYHGPKKEAGTLSGPRLGSIFCVQELATWHFSCKENDHEMPTKGQKKAGKGGRDAVSFFDITQFSLFFATSSATDITFQWSYVVTHELIEKTPAKPRRSSPALEI
jgi:hypothetical protein